MLIFPLGPVFLKVLLYFPYTVDFVTGFALIWEDIMSHLGPGMRSGNTGV